MKAILNAIPCDDYKIKILTKDGFSGIFDVKPYLRGSAFKELKDKSYFDRVSPTKYGIQWPNEQDFSSDTIIYDIKQEIVHGII